MTARWTRHFVPAIFVDTGAFYAVADRGDRNHATATSVFEARGMAGDVVTSDYVFVESWCLIRARLGREAAMQFWDAMRSGIVTMHGVTSEDLAGARAIAGAWPDQDFSLIDCTSFALMERLRLDEALAFDSHFRIYRYGGRRERAFRVFH
jgi:predicted nucleic acid-binding protein